MDSSQSNITEEPEVIPDTFRERVFSLFRQAGICQNGDWFDDDNARRLVGKQSFSITQLRWAYKLVREYIGK